MPLATPSNPFWNPDSSYGASQAWRKTDFVKQFLDPQIPEGVYSAFLGERGMGGTDALSSFAQGLYGKTLAGYKAALRANPDLAYRTYLGKQMGGNAIRNMWLAQSPRQRGVMTAGPTRLIAQG